MNRNYTPSVHDGLEYWSMKTNNFRHANGLRAKSLARNAAVRATGMAQHEYIFPRPSHKVLAPYLLPAQKAVNIIVVVDRAWDMHHPYGESVSLQALDLVNFHGALSILHAHATDKAPLQLQWKPPYHDTVTPSGIEGNPYWQYVRRQDLSP